MTLYQRLQFDWAMGPVDGDNEIDMAMTGA
jgi:hypothetical protein